MRAPAACLHVDRGRVRRRFAVFAIGACAVSAAILGPAANADTLSAKRAQAAAVQAQLAAMGVKLEAAIQAYDAAQQRLDDTRAAIADNQAQLAVIRGNLAAAEAALEGELVATFQNGNPDAMQVLLGAASLNDLVERVDLLQRSSAHTAALVTQVLTLRQATEARKRELDRQQRIRAEALTARAADRALVQAGLAAERQRLNSVQADIRSIIAQQQAAAAAHSRAQIAQAQSIVHTGSGQTAPDPGIGGSGGSGSTSGAPTSNGSGNGSASNSSGSASGSGGAIAPPPASSAGAAAADAALSQLGVPYVWAGASPSGGFDCSGLVMWAYAQVGISLPHNAAAQAGVGTPVSRDQLEKGDLVFFGGYSHVGIYIGGGEIVHAPYTGTVVQIASLDGFPGYDSAVRIA